MALPKHGRAERLDRRAAGKRKTKRRLRKAALRKEKRERMRLRHATKRHERGIARRGKRSQQRKTGGFLGYMDRWNLSKFANFIGGGFGNPKT